MGNNFRVFITWSLIKKRNLKYATYKGLSFNPYRYGSFFKSNVESMYELLYSVVRDTNGELGSVSHLLLGFRGLGGLASFLPSM